MKSKISQNRSSSDCKESSYSSLSITSSEWRKKHAPGETRIRNLLFRRRVLYHSIETHHWRLAMRWPDQPRDPDTDVSNSSCLKQQQPNRVYQSIIKARRNRKMHTTGDRTHRALQLREMENQPQLLFSSSDCNNMTTNAKLLIPSINYIIRMAKKTQTLQARLELTIFCSEDRCVARDPQTQVAWNNNHQITSITWLREGLVWCEQKRRETKKGGSPKMPFPLDARTLDPHLRLH